ncbi:MAG: hypothetical protein K2L12_03255 [Clostridia bacterium]|nr:hypothetical protein [Clostridia bacterium]
MTTKKESHKTIIDGYFYACCPFCKTTLIHGRNGTDTYIKCPQCGDYLHVEIKDDTVMTERKYK